MYLFHAIILLSYLNGILSLNSFSSNTIQANECEISNSCEEANNTDTSHQTKNCRCDSKCFLYGDCCSDAPVKNIYRNAANFYKCTEVKGSGKTKAYYMISKCPTYWPDNEEKFGCHHSTSSVFFTSIPITDSTNNQTYKNIYCAICNNVTLDHLLLWKLNISCESLHFTNSTKAKEHLRYSNHSNQWEISFTHNDSESVELCQAYILPPDDLKASPRECFHNFIDTCAFNQSRKISARIRNLNRRCYSSHYAVRFHGLHVYKNLYCAQCNGISKESLSCQPIKTFTNRPMYRTNRFSHLFAYNLLFRNFAAIHNKVCPRGETRDTEGQCQAFSCSSNYAMNNGVCEEL